MNETPQRQTLGQILFSPSGRLPRKPFWLHGTLLPWVVFLATCALVFGALASPAPTKEEVVGFIMLVPVMLAFIWINFATTIKRLRDRDMSAWWYLLMFLPYLGAIIILVICMLRGTVGPNTYGADSTDLY